MSKVKINFLLALAVLVFVSLACNTFKERVQSEFEKNSNFALAPTNTNTNTKTIPVSETASTSGAERQKPASGKGNVQGKVLYNDQPVEGIEVRICENFNAFMGIKCDGKTLTTRTDKDGVFVLADLDPKVYGGLTAKVFKSAYYVYPREGVMSPQKFTVEADKTVFARDISLFKDDVKIINPKAGSKADASNLELKWDAYPDAAYYRVSLLSDGGRTSPLSNERVDDTSYTVTESLTNGKYRVKVDVYNTHNTKLAESGNDIRFTVTGGAEPEKK